MPTQSLYRLTRDLHLYLGLFVSPFVVVYAISAISLNHATLPWRRVDTPDKRSAVVSLSQTDNTLAMAKDINRQLGITGEIDFINFNRQRKRLTFPVTKPGERTTVRVDMESGAAEIEHQFTGRWDAMNYLHKMPGPHNASVRGNWIYMRLWGWLADASVYLILFSTVSGIYIWAVLKAERRIGLIFLGSGALLFVAVIAALTT